MSERNSFSQWNGSYDVSMAAFGNAVYNNLIDTFNEGYSEVEVEQLAKKAVECGVADYVPYDPHEHGIIDVNTGDMIYWFDGLSDRDLPVTKEWLAVSFDLIEGSFADSFAEVLLCSPVENFERPLTYRWVASSDHLSGKHRPHIKTRGQVRDLIAALRGGK